MQSLKEVYGTMVQHDHVKVAQARAAQGLAPQADLSEVDPALIKQAQDYDHIGRVLAHHVFADLVKEAMDEAGVPEEKKEDELAKIMASARGETPPAEEKKEEAKKEGEGAEEKAKEGETKEAAKRRILAKMAQDPAYVSKLVAKFSGR